VYEDAPDVDVIPKGYSRHGKKLGISGKEAKWEKVLLEGFDRAKHFPYKIPDAKIRSFHRGPVIEQKRPFDGVVWLKGGGAIAYEAKYNHEPTGFGHSQLKDHQIKNLERVYQTGNPAFVVLFVKYNHRVHMLVWPWSYFRGLTRCIGKDAIKALLDGGHSYLSVNGAFPIGAFLDPPHRPLYGLTK